MRLWLILSAPRTFLIVIEILRPKSHQSQRDDGRTVFLWIFSCFISYLCQYRDGEVERVIFFL